MKKAAYVAPVVLTLKAMPALAQVGSGAPVNDAYRLDEGSPFDYDDNPTTPPATYDSRNDPGPPTAETAVMPERSIAVESSSAAVGEDQTSGDWCIRQLGIEPSPRGPRSSEPWHLCD